MRQLNKTTIFVLNVFRDKYGIEDELILKYYNYISIEENAKNIVSIAVNLEMIYAKHPDFKEILKRKMIQATEFLIDYPYTDVCSIKNLILQEKEDFVF